MIRAKHEPASEKVNCIGNVHSPSQARSFPRLLDEAEVMGRPIIDCPALHVNSDELPVPCCVWAHSVAPAESPQQETSVSAKSDMGVAPRSFVETQSTILPATKCASQCITPVWKTWETTSRR